MTTSLSSILYKCIIDNFGVYHWKTLQLKELSDCLNKGMAMTMEVIQVSMVKWCVVSIQQMVDSQGQQDDIAPMADQRCESR